MSYLSCIFLLLPEWVWVPCTSWGTLFMIVRFFQSHKKRWRGRFKSVVNTLKKMELFSVPRFCYLKSTFSWRLKWFEIVLASLFSRYLLENTERRRKKNKKKKKKNKEKKKAQQQKEESSGKLHLLVLSLLSAKLS